MGEGVHKALVDVVMEMGGLNKEQAEAFWESKKEGGQYIAVSFLSVEVLGRRMSANIWCRKHGEQVV